MKKRGFPAGCDFVRYRYPLCSWLWNGDRTYYSGVMLPDGFWTVSNPRCNLRYWNSLFKAKGDKGVTCTVLFSVPNR